MDWFLYDNGLRHELTAEVFFVILPLTFSQEKVC